MLETAKRLTVKNAIAIPLIRGAIRALFLRALASATIGGKRR
jgi:hypothetical protein